VLTKFSKEFFSKVLDVTKQAPTHPPTHHLKRVRPITLLTIQSDKEIDADTHLVVPSH
jgi:hypothetical protein